MVAITTTPEHGQGEGQASEVSTERTQLHTRIDQGLRDQLRVAADEHQRSETWFVEQGLRLILADPALTLEVLAQRQAQLEETQRELAAAQREIKKLHDKYDKAQLRATRVVQEAKAIQQQPARSWLPWRQKARIMTTEE